MSERKTSPTASSKKSTTPPAEVGAAAASEALQGQEALQEAMEKGYVGHVPDPRSNFSYTVAGVIQAQQEAAGEDPASEQEEEQSKTSEQES